MPSPWVLCFDIDEVLRNKGKNKIAELTLVDRLSSWWWGNYYSEIKCAGICGWMSDIKAT